MAISQSHIREIADKKVAYNEGRLYRLNCQLNCQPYVLTNIELYVAQAKTFDLKPFDSYNRVRLEVNLESISSTFYVRIFCQYFGAAKLQSQR